MVSFDPVCSIVGSKATEWVPIIPGTDSTHFPYSILPEVILYDEPD